MQVGSVANKRATIMDVARACGLSKTTVSVILNETPASARVPAETQDRVRKAAHRMGYRPSWRGKVLASRQTRTIGILYTPPMPLVVRGNYEGILAGIHEVVGVKGYNLLMVPLGKRPADWDSILGDQRMDGAIVLSRLRKELADVVLRVRLPVALVNADTTLPFPCVIADDYGGALESTRHLLSLGHRRIALVMNNPPAHYSVTQRQEGYETALREVGLGQFARVVNGTEEQLLAAVTEPGPDRPTAVIAYTHYLAVSLVQLLWRRGLHVPADVSISGFGNAYPVEQMIPPLTTVALPTEEMGREAGRMILEQIEASGAAPPRRVVLRETLVIRESTAPIGAAASAANRD